jgi:hypothetical protein
MTVKRIVFALALFSLCFLSSPATIHAKDLFGNSVCSGGAKNSAVCTDSRHTDPKNDPLSGSNGLLLKITNIIAYIGGAAAIIMLIVGGLRFITSGTDVSTGSRTDTDVEEARHTVAGALIGLAIIVFGRMLILFFLDNLHIK